MLHAKLKHLLLLSENYCLKYHFLFWSGEREFEPEFDRMIILIGRVLFLS